MRSSTPRKWASATAALFLVVATGPAAANDRALADFTLEELLETEVYSVSRASEGLKRSAAAITVLTREDLRRSGARSVAEALRLVPGMQVSRINSSAWAISARGFAGRLANKMLVMVDGRSIYSTTFSGVHWETLDIVFEDIERIEIVRGPGGTMWGMNAVNGVVNIITREAHDTHGLHVSSGGGTHDRGDGTVRVGRGNDRQSWRVYAKGSQRTGFDLAGGKRAPGDVELGQGGFRVDRRLGKSHSWRLQGDVYAARSEELLRGPLLFEPYMRTQVIESDLHGFNLLSEARLQGRGSWTLRTYVDDTGRDSGFLDEHLQTIDLDVHHAFDASGHRLMWGIGGRRQSTEVQDTAVLRFSGDRHRFVWTAFLQDQYGLASERLQLTAGVKVEGYSESDAQWQPSIRATWSPRSSRTTWAAVSRAVRAPSALERDLTATFEVVPPSDETMGMPLLIEMVPAGLDFRSETMIATELGHREQIGGDWQLDLAVFHHLYRGLAAYTPLEIRVITGGAQPYMLLPVVSRNALDGEVAGAEVGLAWQVRQPWRLRLHYTLTTVDLWPADRSVPLLNSEWHREESSTPRHQVQLISWLALSKRMECDNVVTTYSRNHDSEVASWVRWDARVGWRLSPELELSLIGHNLLRGNHLEWRGELGEVENLPGRTVYVGLSWRND